MMLDIESLHLGITDRHSCGVVAGLEVCLYDETGRRGGAANERQDGVPCSQWDAGPVAANLAEEAMLAG